MSTAPLSKKSNTNFTIEEADDIEKDKKKIKTPGFETAYALFKKTLPHIVADEMQFFHTYGFHRVDKLDCECEAYVAKKIRWKEDNYRLRVVFCIKDEVIKIVEIYYKGRSDICDRRRICKHCV